jgi:ParB family chromosome partitioning protein
VERLRPGRYQPRRQFDDAKMDALVQSVKEKGVLQPLLVRRLADSPADYEIIAGERRWRAAQAAQLHEVPVIVKDLDDRECLEIALIENIQREDLSPLDEAEGYQRLTDEFSYTQEVLARAVSKSRSHVANMMRLLNLPDHVKGYIRSGELSAGHARALLGAPDPLTLAQVAIERGLNVRQLEKLVQDAKPPKSTLGGAGATARAAAAPAEKDADTRALERSLSNALGLKVTIEHADSGGRVTIHYGTLDQLDDIIQRLNAAAAVIPATIDPIAAETLVGGAAQGDNSSPGTRH